MKNKLKYRFLILAAISLSMMVALIAQLGTLTLAEGEVYAANANERRTRTTYTSGARGRILDKNGIPLAYDQTSYDVQFLRQPDRLSAADSALYTESLIIAKDIIESGGGALIDASYIRMRDNGEFYYDWGVETEAAIKARYKNFCDNMGFPIKSDDLNDMSKWISAENAYLSLRQSWKIPVEMPYEEAIKIMAIRQEINMNKWRAYEPVTIAYNVPMEVVAQLDMRADEMIGISTIQNTTRVYPYGETAAHVIGYLSRQVKETTLANLERMGYDTEAVLATEDIYATENDQVKKDENGIDLLKMTSLGYSYNDLIGVAGIERTMERYLTSNTYDKRGAQTIETNNTGSITRELEKTAAQNGYDIVTTLDLELQIVAEQALENAILAVREYEETELIAKDQLKSEEERKYKNPDTIKKAETGSIVILDVNTGKVLAMASYPTFDPNIFLQPLSPELTKELFEKEESNQPTLNRAISSRLAPGSIFKMLTGLAGLMEGEITTDTHITDEGPYVKIIGVEGEDSEIDEKDAPKCWVSSGKRHTHANLNLSGALSQSCNYYFFTVANLLGMDKLDEWGRNLGLSTATGIELPAEVTSHIGGQDVLYDNTLPLNQQKSSLPGLIKKHLKTYLVQIMASRGVEAEEDTIDSCAESLLRLQDGSTRGHGEEIRRILQTELGIPITLTRSQNWELNISGILGELQWKPIMTIRSGIGQGTTLTTPVSIARYAATYANGGTVYDVHVVDRILDETGSSIKTFEPTVFNKIEAPDDYWQSIMKGLEGVVSLEDQGTAAKRFTTEFVSGGYVSKISGKSGTAQISTAKNNIDIQNTSWFITFMPRDNPEIVMITCIPNGYSGTQGGITAVEEVTRFFIDRKEGLAHDNLVGVNGLIP